MNKDTSIPVLCIESYPDSSREKNGFYIAKFEDLIKDFERINNAHSHTFYMVMYIYQGSGKHYIDFKTYDISPNQLYFLTPGQVHHWELSADIQGFVLFFEASYFSAIYPKRLFEYNFYHTNQQKPTLHLQSNISLFDTLFESAFLEFSANNPNRNNIFFSYLFLILENANRYFDSQHSTSIQGQYHRIKEFEKYIDLYYTEKKTIRAYAELMNISPNYLNSLCKLYLNKTSSELLQERILIEAQRLLTHSNISIKEIVFRLGFNDESYFIRFFKKFTSQTPMEFRKMVVTN